MSPLMTEGVERKHKRTKSRTPRRKRRRKPRITRRISTWMSRRRRMRMSTKKTERSEDRAKVVEAQQRVQALASWRVDACI
jgi:t-SNARE complex subunit (syntaxin)